MGCFSSTPTYTPPAPPKLPTAQELYGQAQTFGQSTMPNAMGAREGALNDLKNPTAYYAGFQPTSFEQAMGNQQFQNIWPDQQAYMNNVLNKSGMAYSPVAAATMGKAYGNLSMGIGQYLNTQANDRATGSLNARLGIDPMSSIMQPFASMGAQQGNAQGQLDYGYQQALAQQQYQQQMDKFQQQAAMAKMFGQISPIGGGIYGASTGHLGDSLGGSAQSMSQMMPFIMSMMSGGAGAGMGAAASGGGNGVNFVGNAMGEGYGSSLGKSAMSVY